MKKLILGAIMLPFGVAAKSPMTIDPVDGKPDASRFLLERATGFMPIPMLITDPAIGYGAGLGAIFFHETEEQKKIRRENPEKVTTIAPSISGVIGAGTNNGTGFGGAFHQGVWLDDKVRFEGGLFKANINVNFHGFDTPTRMNLKGNYAFSNIDFRLFDSNFFVGAGYHYFRGDVTFAGDAATRMTNKGARADLRLTYDSLNNQFAPTDGIKAKIIYSDYNKRWGGDFNHQRLNVDVRSYHEINNKWSLAWRVNTINTAGDVPFYARPFVQMRGIAALRNQGDNVALGEVQVGYNINTRYQIIGFTGSGTAYDHGARKLDWNNTIGMGFRYTIARQLGIKAGVDVSRSETDTAIQIKFGTAF
ncbi:BamA/TamA family outer membrane protein [Vibrio maritimus]|uniref:BamA/TamA family outer membrane protein n=1 Tax=Vibrio maritimus TaxID=990268 RepID=UPI001F1BE58F|nr:BamA/TamA family outer membrane protein [Vibrio maritimus]